MEAEQPSRTSPALNGDAVCITAGPAVALAATIESDCPPPAHGDPLPPAWHWLYFLSSDRASELGEDGRSRRGVSRQPSGYARAAWGGARLRFKKPLHVGEAAWRVTRVLRVARGGDTAADSWVTVLRHEVRTDAGLVLTEEEDWVHSRTGEAPERPMQLLAPSDAVWQEDIYPNEVLLFRYSALTFNSHRIHFDRRFATECAGHRGLVVQPGLAATLLLELVRVHLPAARITSFSCRTVQPLFDTASFAVCGRPEDDGTTLRLWAKDAGGGLAVSATATVTYS